MTLSHSSAIYGSNFKCFFRGNNRELKQRTFITLTYVNCKLLLSSGGVAVPGYFKDGHERRPASTQANCKLQLFPHWLVVVLSLFLAGGGGSRLII